MPVVLPFRPSIGAYQFRSVLLGSEYRFRVRWNRVDLSWYFDLREVSGEPIVLSVRIVLGVYFARASTHRLFREGAMVARIPQGDDRREAGFGDLGARVQIFYFTYDELLEEIQGFLQRGGP